MLEEEFLELMVHLFRNLPMGDIWQTDVHPSQSSSGDQEAEILQHLQVSPCCHGKKGQGHKAGFRNGRLKHAACGIRLDSAMQPV